MPFGSDPFTPPLSLIPPDPFIPLDALGRVQRHRAAEIGPRAGSGPAPALEAPSGARLAVRVTVVPCEKAAPAVGLRGMDRINRIFQDLQDFLRDRTVSQAISELSFGFLRREFVTLRIDSGAVLGFRPAFH